MQNFYLTSCLESSLIFNWFIGSREEDENVESLQQNANMTEEDKFWPKNSHHPLVQVS